MDIAIIQLSWVMGSNVTRLNWIGFLRGLNFIRINLKWTFILSWIPNSKCILKCNNTSRNSSVVRYFWLWWLLYIEPPIYTFCCVCYGLERLTDNDYLSLSPHEITALRSELCSTHFHWLQISLRHEFEIPVITRWIYIVTKCQVHASSATDHDCRLARCRFGIAAEHASLLSPFL